MTKIRALLIGAGRRNSMIDLLRKSEIEVICYEISDLVPVSINSKIIKGLKFSDSNIKKDIIEKINDNNIDICIPFMDEIIPILSEIKDTNELKCVFLCASIEASEICFDKIKFQIWMEDNFPEYYPSPKKLPKIAKPRFGFSSKELIFIENDNQLSNIDRTKFVIQKRLIGKEYSSDAYFNRYGKFVDCVVRERLRTAGGEVISSITLYNEKIYQACKLIGEKLKLEGPTCFQFIIEDDEPKILEINSRFGGGCILSIESGLDMISLIKKDYFELDFFYRPLSWKKNLLMERYFSETFFDINNIN